MKLSFFCLRPRPIVYIALLQMYKQYYLFGMMINLHMLHISHTIHILHMLNIYHILQIYCIVHILIIGYHNWHRCNQCFPELCHMHIILCTCNSKTFKMFSLAEIDNTRLARDVLYTAYTALTLSYWHTSFIKGTVWSGSGSANI